MTTLEFARWRNMPARSASMKVFNSGVPIEKIILYAQEEYDFYTFPRFKELADYSDKHNIPFYCIANISTPELVNTGHPSVRIVPWKTYCFSLTALRMSMSFTVPVQLNFTYPFVFMNSRLRDHRCSLIDAMAKYDCVDKGAVSWLSLGDHNLVVPDYPYEFKNWTPKVLKLSEMQPAFSYINIFSVPSEYYRSFMQVTTETSDIFNAMTEKTILPLLHKKPFLALSGMNNHLMLQDYGFQLYDEIFDYSYATLPDTLSRCDALARQIASIAKKSPAELTSMKDLIMPKLEYNADLARKLSTDLSYVPEMILEAYENPANVFCSRDIVEFIKTRQNPR